MKSDFLLTCRMEAVLERLRVLDGEIQDLAADIKELYKKKDAEADPSSKQELAGRIKELKEEKAKLDARREKLEEKLQSSGSSCTPS